MRRPSDDHDPAWPVLLWRLARLSLGTVLATLPLGAFAFALALVIWITVSSEENPSVRRALSNELPVEQVNIPRNTLVTEMTPERVTVTISGPRNAVNDVRPDDLTARVDLSRADEELAGGREATIERPVRAEVRRRGVRADVSPETVSMKLERQERRTVPVCVDRVDVPPPGFSVEEPITTDPAEAAITGPRRNIDAVECAAAAVRLSGLTVTVSPQAPLEPRDSAGRAIGGVTVQPQTATVNVRIRQGLFPRQVVVDVRLQGRPAPGYTVTGVRVEPATTTIVGPLDVINAVNTIPTETIDIEGARSELVRSVALQIPPGVSTGERRTVVSIGIQPSRSTGSVGAAPRAVNVAPGLAATIAGPVVAVLVSGPLPEILALRPADLSVTVDAAGLAPGTHRLEPRVTAPPGITVDGVLPDRVEVAIGTAR